MLKITISLCVAFVICTLYATFATSYTAASYVYLSAGVVLAIIATQRLLED
jgi:hypothetical protein